MRVILTVRLVNKSTRTCLALSMSRWQRLQARVGAGARLRLVRALHATEVNALLACSNPTNAGVLDLMAEDVYYHDMIYEVWCSVSSSSGGSGGSGAGVSSSSSGGGGGGGCNSSGGDSSSGGGSSNGGTGRSSSSGSGGGGGCSSSGGSGGGSCYSGRGSACSSSCQTDACTWHVLARRLLPSCHRPPSRPTQDAFCGLPELTAYFKKVEALIPDDVRFVVEDLTEGDPRRCGVRWCASLYAPLGCPHATLGCPHAPLGCPFEGAALPHV